MKTHKHRAIPQASVTRGFTGPARGVEHENRAAHGGVCHVDTCACGHVRETNSTGWHTERGPWLEPRT